MSTASRQRVLSRLLAAAKRCLQHEQKLDAEIAKTLLYLIGLLIQRYLNFGGRSLPVGAKACDGVFTASELRQLAVARADSRGEFSHATFYAVWRDALRGAPEQCVHVISGLFAIVDGTHDPEPVVRDSAPLIQTLENMMEEKP